ncbi:endonuclease/exonuclease/phosphatase family protein [Luteimonas sp. R10]|uniref:endonuclease/exonuclease/phosphatase family protein n=1 Tax=Luteimonas sp. R10 TaxID=3108176 RepID=UPI00308C58B5|nr:endonuclease/exonuclease/phosphatase family protein [Luteimonas sp. R10]
MIRALTRLLPAVATLVLLGACATGAAPAPDAAADGGGATLSVVTLNIYHDRDGWERRRPLVIEGLRALRPDVIGLQEVLQHGTLRNQAADIADALGYDFHFVSTAPEGEVERYGNAILTRHPILERSERRLRPLEDSRTVAHVRIAFDGRPIDIYDTHLHHTAEGGAMRAEQLADVLAHIDGNDDGTPMVLMGDFNAGAGSPELQRLAGRYVDAFGSTHPGDDVTTLNPHYFPDRHERIDHVFVPGDRFEVLESRRVLDRPDADGIWPSDHFGILARLRLSPAR